MPYDAQERIQADYGWYPKKKGEEADMQKRPSLTRELLSF